MKYQIVLIFLVRGVFSHAGNNGNSKHVIGCRKDAGLFFNFFTVLNNLAWCDRNNKTPVVFWDEHSCYYDPAGYNGSTNVWNYYFKPVSFLNYEKGDTIWREYYGPDNTGLSKRPLSSDNIVNYRKRGYRLIKKYIHLRSAVKHAIQEFYKAHMEGCYTIGLHLRGTDKYTEVPQVPVEEIIERANTEAINHPGCQFFVATDEQALLEKAHALLQGKVLYTTAFRSTTSQEVHHQNPINYSKACLGEDVVIDVFLLSKCDLLIHTRSNVSWAALFFNPIMPHILLKK
jgi:hypothetical protein